MPQVVVTDPLEAEFPSFDPAWPLMRPEVPQCRKSWSQMMVGFRP